MADVVRIKPKAAPYRRAGVAFTSDREFQEFGPADLTPRQVATLCADAELTIELQVDGKDDDWEPLPPEARAEQVARLETMTEAEWAEVETAWRESLPPADAGEQGPAPKSTKAPKPKS